MPEDLRKNHRNFYFDFPIDQGLELLADWPMAPENRAELDDTIWALRALADDGKITLSRVVLMDWNQKESNLTIRERSMVRNLPNPQLLPEDQAIANIFQGRTPKAEGNYPGDAEMKFEDSLTIQVHRVAPLINGKKQPEVVALALIVPNSTSGFVAELPARKGSK